jgi:ubiquinone/menaquinone biosynthesis C-methylase UbiE
VKRNVTVPEGRSRRMLLDHARAASPMSRRPDAGKSGTLARPNAKRGRQEMAADEVAPARAVWRLGDYHRFAREQIWEVGPVVVEACGISPGQRVLDVAAGSGNVAIRAAKAGADVVAADITPENFEPGRKEAETLGVALEWVEADAQALPFGDDGFDVVTSSFGIIFAPDHQRVANEMLRVCRPGGTIGLAAFPPGGMAEEIFGVVAPYMPPPPPGAQPPELWGTEAHVRELFGERIESLQIGEHVFTERAPSPQAYVDLYKETFGPVISIYESLRTEPDRAARLDSEFLDFAERANRGTPDGPAAYPYEYVVIVARKRSKG